MSVYSLFCCAHPGPSPLECPASRTRLGGMAGLNCPVWECGSFGCQYFLKRCLWVSVFLVWVLSSAPSLSLSSSTSTSPSSELLPLEWPTPQQTIVLQTPLFCQESELPLSKLCLQLLDFFLKVGHWVLSCGTEVIRARE